MKHRINNETTIAESIKRLPKKEREEINKLLLQVCGNINSIECRLRGTELESNNSIQNLWNEAFELKNLFSNEE
jgi:mRNA-degrading endonuclease RelE of RelBE toxin-antitoxin system